MGPWGFVFLAYGAAWIVLLVYFFSLKQHIRRAEKELAMRRSSTFERP